MASDRHWPTEIRLAPDKRHLTVAFEDGARFELPAEYLRVTSPSAEVQGHTPEERKTIGGKRDVAIVAVEPVGNYAVRLVFDDRHDTGIYSWDYLYWLGAERDRLWQEYLDRMQEAGASRDPADNPALPKEGGCGSGGCGGGSCGSH
jgi:DUF971 family protein